MGAHVHVHTCTHTHTSSSPLFSVDFHTGHHREVKGQTWAQKAPLPPVEWDLRQIEKEPTKLSGERTGRRKQLLSRKILIASKRERKKAQKSNTSKGTMNVEFNGIKPFLRLNSYPFFSFFACGFENGSSFVSFVFKRWVLKADL